MLTNKLLTLTKPRLIARLQQIYSSILCISKCIPCIKSSGGMRSQALSRMHHLRTTKNSTIYKGHQSIVNGLGYQSIRNYSGNPFNPFHTGSNHYFSSSYFRFLRATHFSRTNPFHPLNRYKLTHWLMKNSRLKSSFKYNTRFPTSIWRLSFRNPTIGLHNSFCIFSDLCQTIPKSHGRLFTTYACGGPIPSYGFSTGMTNETIKNIAISIRTLFNLDKSYRPIKINNKNDFKAYPKSQSHESINKPIKSKIRLNLSLQPEYTENVYSMGQEATKETTSVADDERLEQYRQQQIISGCYVEFELGDKDTLSIPAMTFLTDDILSEINANLTYISRRIEELKVDFQNLSELGELPIKYLPKENVIRVYFPNCDKDKVETLLKEKCISGGVIYEEKLESGNFSDDSCAAPIPEVISEVCATNITENDLLSTFYQSGTTRSSEQSSISFDDDILSSMGSSSNHDNIGSHPQIPHPLADAEVVRIDTQVDNGPITINESSGEDYYWINRL